MTVCNLFAQIPKRRPSFLRDRREFVATELRNEIFDKHGAIFAQRKDVVNTGLCAAPILSRETTRFNVKMKKHEYRRQWLRDLQKKEGTVAAFAEKIGTQPNYLSSILGPNAKRNPGDDLTHRAEIAYDLLPGAMDLPSIGAQKLIKAAEGMSDADLEEVVAFMKFKKGSKK